MALFAHGTALTIGGTAINGITSLSLPDESRDLVDVTDHNSSGTREFVAGLRDGGTVNLEANYMVADTGQLALVTNFDAAGTTAAFVLTLPGGTGARTYTFTGIVTALGGDAPHDGAATLTATIKAVGAVAKGVVAGGG